MPAIRIPRVLLIIMVVVAGCRQQQLNSTDVQLELTASELRVGETSLVVRVTDRDGKAISAPGSLSVRGDMDHAGMVPVLAKAESAVDGVFSLPFEWTMGGAWIVEARLTLPNGDVAFESFQFEILSEAPADDMMAMDHGELPGESSALYLRIHNRGQSDATLVAASSPAAREVAFHRTVTGDGMARMKAVESLHIPAGKTLELAPGGLHIMLTSLTTDLLPDSAMTLRLAGESGETYDLDIRILDMPMGDLDDAFEIGDLVFSNRWARPASAGRMDRAEMGMSATASS